ncbi:MAG: SIR2 family protein [Alphaproteobacteria bacterium]|nr:SIR2 family protein [Alphaproteobacteria bacterium]MBF0249386.1 SIR2 family protein [Alphaproteobacteria bacterium]
MTTDTVLYTIAEHIRDGQAVPYLGPGALEGCVSVTDGTPMPADSHSLILAMNNGRPMAPKLMYEFPRAAMNLELKKGRGFINRFLTTLYGETQWSRAAVHDWLAALQPEYVIDINRDSQLQDSYNGAPHILVRGTARIGGTDFRFQIHEYDGEKYREISHEEADPKLPVLFKPMGSPTPYPTYIASDADYVDYITELMGGFAIPSFLKEKRKGLKYVLLGMRLTRDTERMVMSDILHDSHVDKGWALIPNATDKEKRFCSMQGITVVDAGIDDFLSIAKQQMQAAS